MRSVPDDEPFVSRLREDFTRVTFKRREVKDDTRASPAGCGWVGGGLRWIHAAALQVAAALCET